MWPWWVNMPFKDLTHVTPVSDDAFQRLDWCDSGEWWRHLETWLMWLWWVRMPFRDLTDVIIVKEVMTCDVSPVAMFYETHYRRPTRCHLGQRKCQEFIWFIDVDKAESSSDNHIHKHSSAGCQISYLIFPVLIWLCNILHIHGKGHFNSVAW